MRARTWHFLSAANEKNPGDVAAVAVSFTYSWKRRAPPSFSHKPPVGVAAAGPIGPTAAGCRRRRSETGSRPAAVLGRNRISSRMSGAWFSRFMVWIILTLVTSPSRARSGVVADDPRPDEAIEFDGQCHQAHNARRLSDVQNTRLSPRFPPAPPRCESLLSTTRLPPCFLPHLRRGT
jgi:hypothetical protein